MAPSTNRFSKLAAKELKKRKSRQQEMSDAIQRDARYSLGTMATNMGLFGTTLALLKSKSQPAGEAMVERVKDLADKMGLAPGSEYPSVHIPSTLKERWSPFYSPDDHLVNIPSHSRDAIVLHELGHAKNSETMKSIMGGTLETPYRLAEQVSRLGSTVTAIPMVSWAARQKDDNLNYTPGIIQAILSAPMLAEEAAASARAVATLVQEHGALKGIGKSLPLLPAFGTYATIAAAPAVVTYLRKRALQRELEKGKEKISADLLKGGLADKKKPSQFDKRALLKGMKVEREHSSDPRVQLEISMDHLTEDPRYYDKLEKMENGKS